MTLSETMYFLSLSEQKIRKFPVIPVICLKLGRPMRKSALRSVRKLSLLFTVLVVTLASFAISERFFLGSFRIDQMILQSVSEGIISQGGSKLDQMNSSAPH